MKLKEKVVQLVWLMVIESDQYIYRNEDSIELLQKFKEKEGKDICAKSINLDKLANLDLILNKVFDVLDTNNKENN